MFKFVIEELIFIALLKDVISKIKIMKWEKIIILHIITLDGKINMCVFMNIRVWNFT